MKAIILAAGLGKRLGAAHNTLPKCLLAFADRSLLHRHLDLLNCCGINDIVIGIGYRPELIAAALAAHPVGTTTTYNPEYAQGSVVTLWCLREHLRGGTDVLLMDADVLYDIRLLERLIDSAHSNCFLLDRDFEPGEEPVKLCVKDGCLVEFRKRVEVDYDFCGESVGFFRLSPKMAARLAAAAERYVTAGRRDEPYEEALRDLLLAEPQRFWFEDVTGLPWIEIDFPEDVARAEREILPRLTQSSHHRDGARTR